MTTSFEADAKLIEQHICPVCSKRPGCRNSNRALLMHLRRRRDTQHLLWKAASYAKHFRVGNHMKKLPRPTPSDIRCLIVEHFGADLMRELEQHNTTI